MPSTTHTVYRCTFEDGRIGRSRGHEPQDFAASSADELATVVYGFARKHLLSSDVDVSVDLAEGRGIVFCGFHVGARFAIAEVTP